MKKEILKDYLLNGKIDIDRLLDNFYGYVYIVVKNGISIYLKDEDIEEIISDVFIAVWKNSKVLSNTIDIKAYLSGTAKNIIKNKYRKNEINFSIFDYEEKLIDNNNLEKQAEENEQNIIIKDTLQTLKKEEYAVFIMFYYENRTVKEIAEYLNCTIGKVKIILHRVRKRIRKKQVRGVEPPSPAWEANNLKEKIRKNVKEEIAISNIRKEFDMKTSKNKKLVYAISSVCAVFVLGVGIFLGTNQLNNDLFQEGTLEIGKAKESLDIELNINILNDIAMMSLDVDTKTIELEQLPKEFMFIENLLIPEEYEFENSYTVYTRENREIAEYNKLHDYILNYKKDDLNNIKIAFSKLESPIRDYYIQGGDKISKIGDVELKISQWEEMYIVTFEYKEIYFDIETTGITKEQLVNLLESLINNITNIDKVTEEKVTV